MAFWPRTKQVTVIAATAIVTTLAAKAQSLPDPAKAFFSRGMDTTVQVSGNSELKLKTSKDIYTKETQMDTVNLKQVITYAPGQSNTSEFAGVPGTFKLNYDADKKVAAFFAIEPNNPVQFMLARDGLPFVYILNDGSQETEKNGYRCRITYPDALPSNSPYAIRIELITTKLNLNNLALPVDGTNATVSVSGMENAVQYRLVSHPTTLMHNIEKHDLSVVADTLLPPFATFEPVSTSRGKIKLKDITQGDTYSTGVSRIIISMQGHWYGQAQPETWHNGSRHGHPNPGINYLAADDAKYVEDANGNWNLFGATPSYYGIGDTTLGEPAVSFYHNDSTKFVMLFRDADGKRHTGDGPVPIYQYLALRDKRSQTIFSTYVSTAIYNDDASLEIFHHQDSAISDTAVYTMGINPYFTVTWSTKLVVGVDDPTPAYSPQNVSTAYPNPVQDEVTIPVGDGSATVIISNELGQVYRRKASGNLHLPIHSWPSGAYFVSIVHVDGKIEETKFIKE